MASNLNYKQVANVKRRTWDLETYEKRAKERQKQLDEGKTFEAAVSTTTTTPSTDEFRPANAQRAGPEGSKRAFLQARESHADIDAKVGTTEMISDSVSKTDGVTKSGVGWHCRVCDCFLKDSHTYLDHINGRKHQAKLGYTMRVEASTKEQVAARLEALRREQAQPEEVVDLETIMERKDALALERKKERQRRRKERKKLQKQEEPAEQPKAVEAAVEPQTQEETEKEEPEKEEEEDEIEGAIDPALAAMMGFGGFGGGNKNG